MFFLLLFNILSSGQIRSAEREKSLAATYFPAVAAVSSASEGLTSVFGMGTGISPPLWPPGIICLISKTLRACPGLVPPGFPKASSCLKLQGVLGYSIHLENDNMVKPHDLLVLIGSYIAAFIPSAYQPDSLSGVFRRVIPSVMIYLEEGFPLRCFQRLSLPNVATQHLPLAG